MPNLLTGHSGFLGSAIKFELNKRDKLLCLGRNIHSDIPLDLTYPFTISENINHLIHAAGLAHINHNQKNDSNPWNKVNVVGTFNLLKALDDSRLKSIIYISSVSVYGCLQGQLIEENHSLDAKNYYGISKIEAENLVINFALKKNIPFLILRLPLLSGPYPPGNLGQMINAIKNGTYIRISSGVALKSIVNICDIAIFCANWVENTSKKSGIYNLTDGVNPSISDIENSIYKSLQKKLPLNIPKYFLYIPAYIGNIIPGFPLNTNRLKQLTSSLTFSDTKAKLELGWDPKPALSYPWTI